MPAVYINGDGVMEYYIPPPPRPPAPPPTGTSAPGFQHAVTVAQQATTSYNSGHGSKTAALDDWGAVESLIAEQYRLALTSAHSHAAVAALDKQYASYFQNHGHNSTIYNEVVGDGKEDAKNESNGMRKAQIQLFNAYNEPSGSTTQSVDIVTASINVELETKFGDAKGGAYTSAQINAAAAAVAKEFGSSAAPFVNFVASTMGEKGGGAGMLTDVLNVLQSPGLQLTPTEIQTGTIGALKLTPAEIQSGTLILTPGESQLAAIDPVTLAFLMSAGVTVPTLSPQMAQLATQNPTLFSYMELNGVNISVAKAGSASSGTPGNPVFSLGNGSVLDITINGKPITDQQLPPGWSQSTAVTNVVSLYLGAEASSKGSGVVQLANMLLPQLQVNPKALPNLATASGSNPAATPLASLESLMQYADGVRSQYASGQLTTLLDGAPPPTSSGAAGYIGSTVNPFLNTQLNGFFFTNDQQSFWSSDPSISALTTYLQKGLAAPFQSFNRNSLLNEANYLTKALSGASPEEANLLLGLVEHQVDKVNLNNTDMSYRLGETRLLTALSAGVQIADQLPGAPPDAAAKQVAGWINSPHGVQLLNGSASTLFDVTAYYGDSDLADALVNSIETLGGGVNLYKYNVELGGMFENDVQDGEQYYTSAQQKQLGTTDYNAFQHNKAETLADFRSQFSNAPGIGTTIPTSDTSAVSQAIINANGWTPTASGPGKPATLTSQQNNILKLDLSWIQSQSQPGSTVTVLPFLFTSSGLGVQPGVFFDISNPNANDPQDPSHELIDGSAAGVALKDDPNAYKHPSSVDVKWHYSSYRDFQLSNDMYQGGTIYTLLNNPLGIGANGEASSASDFHKDFDSVMNVVANEGVMAAGIVLAPVTAGGSLAVAGGISLAWNTYGAISQYDQTVSHGEHFGWSNPNTRWDIVGDSMLAANYLTLGAGGAASGFESAAETFSSLADMPSSIANIQTALATLPEGDAEGLTAALGEGGMVPEGGTLPEGVTMPEGGTIPEGATTPEGGTIPEGDALPAVANGSGVASSLSGVAGLTDALNGLSAMNSNIATGLNWVKTGSEVVGYGLGAVQTGNAIYSTATNWDSMSWDQRLEGVGNIGMGFLPFFMGPLQQKVGEVVWGRNGSSDDSDGSKVPAGRAPQGANKTEDGDGQDPSSVSSSRSVGGEPPPQGPALGTGAEGDSEDQRQVLTAQFNTHVQNVSDALQSSDPSVSASVNQRWQDVIVAAREYGAAQQLNSSVTAVEGEVETATLAALPDTEAGTPLPEVINEIHESQNLRTAALGDSKSKLDTALDRLTRTDRPTDPDCTQAGCGGQIDSDGYCDECGMSPVHQKTRVEIFSEIRAALPNTAGQDALLNDVYGELVQGPGGTYVQDSLTAEQFANSYLFVPDKVFEWLSANPDESQEAFLARGPAVVVVREGLGGPDFADFLRNDSEAGQPVATVSTAKSILAHEAGHLVTWLRNPDFYTWAHGVKTATGFDPEEAISEVNAWQDFGVHPERVSGSAFPYAHSVDQATAALDSGGTTILVYPPETVAAEYLYQRAGRAVYLAQSDGNEEALTHISPQEYRDAGQNLVFSARYGGDPAAMAIVSRLVEGPVAKFFNTFKSDSDQGDTNSASGLTTDPSTRVVTGNSNGTPDESNSSGNRFPSASPQAQAAFETLFGPDGARWSTDTWNAINDYVTAALRSPDSALRTAAQNARDVLGDPAGDPPRIILSADDADVLGKLIAADIGAMQRANSGVAVPAATATPTVALTNSPATIVLTSATRQGDASAVTNQLAQVNGDATSRNGSDPLFGSKKADRKQLATTQALLGSAGYDGDVGAELAAYLPTVPRSEGLGILSDLNDLSPDDHAQIQGLTTELLDSSPAMSNPAEFSARLLVDLAGLSPAERQRVFDNAQTLLAPPQQWQPLADFINSDASGDDSAMNAHQAALLLALPGTQDRGTAIDTLTSLVTLGNESAAGSLSPGELAVLDGKVKAHVSGLVDIASTNNVPVRLVESFGTPSASPLDAAINLMPVTDGIRDLPSSSSGAYESAGQAIAGKINALLEANKAGASPPGALNILLDTGVVDDNTSTGLGNPGASGPVATALITESLRTIQALGKKAGLSINVTLATDFRSKPILTAAVDAVGAKGVRIVDPLGPADRQGVFNDLNPDIYISIGQSETNPQASSFLELASARPETTTFAISNGTDAGGAHALGVVDYPLTASTVLTGAQVLVARVSHELGSSNVPLWNASTSKVQVKPTQVSKAYEAALSKGAELDDGLSVKSLVGASMVTKRAIGSTLLWTPSEPDPWGAQFAHGYSQRIATQGGFTVSDYDDLLSRAAPGSAFDKSVVATQGLLHRANTANRNSLLTLVGLAGAGTLGVVGMTTGIIPAGFHGDYETLLATLGTVPRQLDIIDKTLLTQWDWYARKRGITVADDQNLSQVNLQRRSFWSDAIRTVTYPVTGAADVYSLVTTHASTFAGYSAHGAEILLLPVVGWLEYVYVRKLGNTSIDAEGKFTTDLNSNLKGWEVKANQYGAYAGFSGASAGLILASISPGAPYLSLPYLLVYGRSFGNFGQTYSAWKEQITGKKPEILDTVATIIGSGSIVVTQGIESVPGVKELWGAGSSEISREAAKGWGEIEREVTKGWDIAKKDLSPPPN